MLNADFKQTFPEKLLVNGRMLQPAASAGLCDRIEVVEVVESATDGSWWKVLLQAQSGASGVSFGSVKRSAGRRSQCFFVKTGISEKAQYR